MCVKMLGCTVAEARCLCMHPHSEKTFELYDTERLSPQVNQA